MADKKVIEGTDIRASQFAELFRLAAIPRSHVNRYNLQQFLEGKLTKRIVDLDADPYVTENWRVVTHKKGGRFEWDPEKVTLYISLHQQKGKTIDGRRLRDELDDQPVFNANLLDLLRKPENEYLIPEEWKAKNIHFWGTVYNDAGRGGLFVRALTYTNDGWVSTRSFLTGYMKEYEPAAVLAN